MKLINFLNNSAETAEDREKLFKLLTENALADKHTSWEYIKNPIEWGLIRKTKASLYKVIELYERVYKRVYKEYCKQVRKNNFDFSIIVALKHYQCCKKFYEQELDTVIDMLDEYSAYVWRGHFLSQFIYGQNRESWHLWDHRQENFNGN